MIAAGLVGMVLTLAALRDRPAGREVAVAAHDIHAGDALVPTDLRLVRVDADDDVLATVVRGRDLGHVRGLVATARIGAGELVPRRGLRPQAAPGGLRAMSIPIDPARAVGGRLASGDRVDVVFAGRDESSIIVADALVLSVDARGRGGIGESASPFTVTVAVDARQSELLAAAIADGNLSLTLDVSTKSLLQTFGPKMGGMLAKLQRHQQKQQPKLPPARTLTDLLKGALP